MQSVEGSVYVVIFVDDFSRFKVTKFLRKKSDATDALKSFIADLSLLEAQDWLSSLRQRPRETSKACW